MTDEEIMEDALKGFSLMGREKFVKGIKEHNRCGKKGLARMKTEDLVKAVQEEVIDLWFYTNELKRRKL
jgi:hypothetical protein